MSFLVSLAKSAPTAARMLNECALIPMMNAGNICHFFQLSTPCMERGEISKYTVHSDEVSAPGKSHINCYHGQRT